MHLRPNLAKYDICFNLFLNSHILIYECLSFLRKAGFWAFGCCIDLTWIKDVHTHLKCNLVNFDIPQSLLWYRNPFGISKLTRLHYKGMCTSFIRVRSMQWLGKNRSTSISTMFQTQVCLFKSDYEPTNWVQHNTIHSREK